MKWDIINWLIDNGALGCIVLGLALLVLVVWFAGWLRAGESSTARRLRER